MKILFSFLIVLTSNVLTPTGHDVPVAVFQITESKGMANLEITFDLEDFTQSLDITTNEVNLKNMQKYLDKNTSFQFNTRVAKINVSEVKIARDHIKVKGDFGKVEKNIKTLKIENTCLNNIHQHSNVIQVDLNNKSRDFRMHKKRTVIDLEY